MVYIGQRAAHLITGCVVCMCVYSFTVGGLTGLAESLFASWLLPTCAFTHPLLTVAHAPFAHLGPMHVQPPSSPGVQRRGRVKEALSREAGKPAGPLSGAGMQKMWKQLGSESWGFQSPEVTKGFHPGSVGRGGRRWATDSDGIL